MLAPEQRRRRSPSQLSYAPMICPYFARAPSGGSWQRYMTVTRRSPTPLVRSTSHRPRFAFELLVSDNHSHQVSDIPPLPPRLAMARIGSCFKNTGIRSWISVHDFSRSPVSRFFHSSQSPATVRSGEPSAAVKYQGCFPPGVFCHS